MAARQTSQRGVTDMHNLSERVKKHESFKTLIDSCLKFSVFGQLNIVTQLDESYRLAVPCHNDEYLS
ncbi:zinc finger MYM-type protein 1-like%2C partial [Xyrichtys novacula]|uniref:Zinc finger MYM-type protein 1-like, partial n=1 Tax=Xyrichtys novacula TaxID=13765 RepID=A0AAV1GUP6_XYRNO|nr:zinc finger MYM-type protein 1-like%2C partial [Xyrichtys novacula]